MSGSLRSSGEKTGAQTLYRGLDLLERMVREPMRLTDAAREIGLPLSTTRRLVQALLDRGFLAQGAKGRFATGPKLLELGARASAFADPVAVARTHLRRLAAETGHCTFLGRRDGDWSVHLHRSQGTDRVLVATPPGTRRRLDETSLGKALLLDDPDAWPRLFAGAAEGWEVEMRTAADAGVIRHHGGPPDNIRAIAAPVRDASGRIVVAISLATIALYLDDAAMETLAPKVRAAADRISAALGWRGDAAAP
jgi:DNA-binding IclR family transcriptional regulator